MTDLRMTARRNRKDDRVTDAQWADLFMRYYNHDEKGLHESRRLAALEEAFRRASSGQPFIRIRSKCLTDARAKHDHETSYRGWAHYQYGGTPSKAPLCECKCHTGSRTGGGGSGGAEHPDHPQFGRICPGKYAHLV